MGRNLMNSVPLGLSLPLGLKGLQCTQVGSTTATHTNINSNLAGMTNRPKLATNQSLILLKQEQRFQMECLFTSQVVLFFIRWEANT